MTTSTTRHGDVTGALDHDITNDGAEELLYDPVCKSGILRRSSTAVQ